MRLNAIFYPTGKSSFSHYWFTGACERALTKEAKEDLNWWATHPTSWNGKSIIRGNPDLTIETDASNTGWGARCGSLQTGGPWSPTEARMHIKCLELLSATFAIQAFAKKQENILVHLKMAARLP